MSPPSASMPSAGTGDEEFKKRVGYMVSERHGLVEMGTALLVSVMLECPPSGG